MFCENHSPARQSKYKKIDFAPSNQSIMPNQLPSTNLERFQDGLNIRSQNNSAQYSTRKLSQVGQNGHLQTPMTLSSGQQYLLNDIKSSVKKG